MSVIISQKRESGRDANHSGCELNGVNGDGQMPRFPLRSTTEPVPRVYEPTNTANLDASVLHDDPREIPMEVHPRSSQTVDNRVSSFNSGDPLAYISSSSEGRSSSQRRRILRIDGEPIVSDISASIDRSDIKRSDGGGFSTIYQANRGREKVAVKVLRTNRSDNIETIHRRLRREILIWSQLDHPNITPLLGIALFSELSDLQAMVTPWYEHGSAFHYLKENRPCALERIELAIGVANGLQYLHQLTPVVVHADLKPVNILIDDQKRPRICDFGLSHMIDQANTGLTTTTPHMATLRYTAHEIISREDDEGFSPSTASDVFSLGCVIYEVMTGNLPYRSCKSNQQLMRMTLNGEQPASRPMQRKTTNEKEDRLWDLMENCWGTKPELRPRAEEVWRELKTIASIQSDFLLFPCKPAGNGGSGSCRHILRSKSRRASTGNSQVMEDILGSVSQEDNVIAVMGATGVGKSSFIRVATGNSSVKVGNSLLSCTDKIQPIGCLHYGRKFVFLDTPGFDDTTMTDVTVLGNIAEWLACSYKKGIKLTGLLYLHRISDNRMSGSSLRTLEMFKHVCGEDALQNVILVTTMGDAVNKSEWTARENALREEFWQPMITSGAQMMRFEQTSESAWNIIDQLSGVRRPIQLQREMVDTGKDLSQTAAGRSLFGWISRKVAEIQALIQTLKDTLKGTRKNPEDAKNAELLAAKEKELKLAQEQKKKLTFASSPFRNWNRRRAATLWTPQ